MKTIFEKSLCVNKRLKKGHILTFEDIEAKRPNGHGISAKKYQNIIGKKLIKDLKQWEFLKGEYIE